MKKLIVLILLLSMLIPVNVLAKEDIILQSYDMKNSPFAQTVNVTETAEYVSVDNGLSYTMDLYKNSAGYDVIKSKDGSILVHSQRYTVEFLDKSRWKQIGTPYSLTYTRVSENEITVTRHYTDYLDTSIDVVYHIRAGEPVKMDVVLNSGEKRVYRIVWHLDGITYTETTRLDKAVKFSSLNSDTWIGFDWNDAYAQFGDIVNQTVSTTAQGRKLNVVFSVGQVNEGETLILDPVVLDGYSESNYSSYNALRAKFPSGAPSWSAVGQSFQAGASDQKIVRAAFYLDKSGSPTGNLYARLYAHSGTFGSSSVPTGAPLATSEPVDISTVGGGYALYNFDFNASEQYTMQTATYYCIVVMQLSGTVDGSNYIGVGMDASSPTHAGNKLGYINGGWSADGSQDTIFYVYVSGVVSNRACDSTATFSRNVPGWVNVTVTETGGVADLNTVDIQVNTTNDFQNFTLRWTQSTNTFSEVSDPDNICSLNTTQSTRINLNATTDQICFRFTMTGGADGGCDVEVTSTNDAAVSDTDLYAAEFTYSTYEWSDAGDLINSLFDHFKIPGGNFLGKLTGMVDGFMLYMIDSMTYVVDIVVQPLRIVLEASGWVIRWVTRMVTFVILLGETIHDIFSGSYSSWNNFWDIINLAAWYDFIPIAVFISWMTRLDYQTKLGRNTIEVAVSDIQMVYSLLAMMMDLMFRVIDFVINNVLRMLDAVKL